MIKKWIFLICISLLFSVKGDTLPNKKNIKSSKPQTICLNMIVKNESEVIKRCLASVKPFIDYWVIVDTGSTDGTQKIIKEFMKDKPGKLYERPWEDFAHNRNEAMILAKNCGDFLLFVDADDILRFSENFVMPTLDKDCYYLKFIDGGTRYNRIQLVNNHCTWKWEGVLHETIKSGDAKTADVLNDVFYVRNPEGHADGYRSKDPGKYHKDAIVLEKALEKDPTNNRYVLYLAQSYKDAKEYALALKNYEKSVAMGDWDQEIYWSLHNVGAMQEALEMPEEIVVKSYCKAYQYRPTRVESLYHLINYYCKQNKPLLGYIVCKHALSIPLTQDILFVEHWMYDFGILLQLANCSYLLGKLDEAKVACQKILMKKDVPLDARNIVENNLMHIESKISSHQSLN